MSKQVTHVLVVLVSMLVLFGVVAFLSGNEGKEKADQDTEYIVPDQQPSGYIVCAGAGSALHQEIMWPVIQEAYREIGVQAEMKIFPALRSLEMANNNYDGEVGRLEEVIAQYEHLVKVPAPLMPLELCVFTLKDGAEFSEWSDFAGKAVAIRRGVKYVEKRMQDHPNTLTVEQFDQAVGLLVNKRIDVVVGIEVDFMRAVKEQRANGVAVPEIIVRRFETRWIYHCVHKKHSALIPQLAEALNRMVDQGRFTQRAQMIFAASVNK